ncbi:hypothetical protein CDD82_1469 [Ophiocordyceps australis]|uniref:Uncharacterized protein n=1 Tax=Ophiocordyceps australis TaxID=1399860 RepID=A0A2C5YIC9_9HYPO|nr:hypothetical protein CDD82_1469 [Ophiocordyceps australis]
MDGNKGFATGAGRERNGARPLAELQVTHQGRRLLFGAGGAAEQKGINGGGAATAGPSRATRISSPPRTAPHARRTKSESQSASPASSASSAASRIPRPGSAASSMSQRRPRLTLVESFRLAEQEEMDALQVHEMNGSPSPAPRAYGGRQGSSDEGERLPELVPGIQDMPVSSPDARGGGRRSPERGVVGGLSPYRGMGSRYSPAKSVADRYSPRKPAPYETPPEKSFAWNVDADFTARDLQVSSSPRIKVGSNRPFANRPSLVASATAPKSNSPSRLGQQNNKLAEIRAREIALKENEAPAGLSQPRATMSVLEELRAREMSVAGLDGSQRRKNTKLDEIRRLENMGLSRKEYAAARLEEIAEKNAMARSLSPDIQASPPKLKTVQEEQVGQQDMYGVDKSAGEPIPHTPVTVYKNYRGEAHRETRAAGARPGLAGKRSDSQEVLRRLARATSFSPPTQGDKQSPRKVMQQSDANDRVENGVAAWRLGARIGTDVNKRPSALASTKNSSSSNSNKENDGPKASVAFTGLRRTESIESTCSKRSDMDAVARIEAEMKLFAPHDTHSERGSVRAPSPATTLTNDDEAANEATPRAARPDFASMPTPRVTGAYVETPLTARRGRRAAQDSADYETTSDPGTEEAKDDAAGVRASLRDAAAPRRRQRSRSVPRQQKRGVVQNSAQPISVRQDMQDMRRLYNIEDSTVDDVDEVLRGLRGGQTKQRQEEMLDDEGEGEGEGEALYTRMARSLRSIR